MNQEVFLINGKLACHICVIDICPCWHTHTDSNIYANSCLLNRKEYCNLLTIIFFMVFDQLWQAKVRQVKEDMKLGQTGMKFTRLT